MANKQKKIIITLASVIVILSLVSIVSLVYNFLGGFYQSRVVRYKKILGETQTIIVDGVGVYCTACNFSGVTLLDDDISQNVYIKTTNLQEKINMRAKIYVVGYENKNNELFGYTNWITSNQDDFIYFNQLVGANEQIGLCKYVRLDGSMSLESNKDYILIFVVETYLDSTT